MAKSATSLLRTLPKPFGEVAPTMARPGAPSALMTVAKSLAIRLALRSPGSARTVNSLLQPPVGPGSGASASMGLAAAGASGLTRVSAERAAPPDAMPQHSFAIFKDRTAIRHHSVGDFLRLGGQVPSRQQHGETQSRDRADRTAPRPPPKLPQTKIIKMSGARPDAFRSSSRATLGQQMRPHQGNQDIAPQRNCSQMLGLMRLSWRA